MHLDAVWSVLLLTESSAHTTAHAWAHAAAAAHAEAGAHSVPTRETSVGIRISVTDGDRGHGDEKENWLQVAVHGEWVMTLQNAPKYEVLWWSSGDGEMWCDVMKLGVKVMGWVATCLCSRQMKGFKRLIYWYFEEERTWNKNNKEGGFTWSLCFSFLFSLFLSALQLMFLHALVSFKGYVPSLRTQRAWDSQ